MRPEGGDKTYPKHPIADMLTACRMTLGIPNGCPSGGNATSFWSIFSDSHSAAALALSKLRGMLNGCRTLHWGCRLHRTHWGCRLTGEILLRSPSLSECSMPNAWRIVSSGSGAPRSRISISGWALSHGRGHLSHRGMSTSSNLSARRVRRRLTAFVPRLRGWLVFDGLHMTTRHCTPSAAARKARDTPPLRTGVSTDVSFSTYNILCHY